MFGEGCYERDSVFDCSGTALLCNVLLLVFCSLPWGCTVLCIFFFQALLIFIIFFLYTSMCCVFRFFFLSLNLLSPSVSVIKRSCVWGLRKFASCDIGHTVSTDLLYCGLIRYSTLCFIVLVVLGLNVYLSF